MTKREAEWEFREIYKELYKAGADYWTAQLAWAEFTDSLCREGRITQKQYETWKTPFKVGHPFHLKK